MEDLGTLITKLGADLTDLKKGLGEGRRELAGFEKTSQTLAARIKSALSFIGLAAAAYLAFSKIKQGIKEIWDGIEDFEVGVTGMAAALTDLAKKDTGLDYGEIFEANLAKARQMYTEMEREDAQHWASAQEMAQAYNQFLQQGYEVRQQEIGALGQIVDLIKLRTAGQNQEVQINQEIRALLQGQATAHSAIARELEARLGPGWKELVEEHRRAGDLVKWLASLYPGIDAATGKITNTLTAQKTTLMSLLKLVGREGLAGAYEDGVNLLKQVNDWLRQNENLSQDIRLTWVSIKEMLILSKEALRELADVFNELTLGGFYKIPEVIKSAGLYLREKRLERYVEQKEQELMKALLQGEPWSVQQGGMWSERYRMLWAEAQKQAREWAKEEFPPVFTKDISLAGRFGAPETEARKKEDEQAKTAAKGHAEDLLKILTGYLEAKREAELKAAEESLKTLKSEHDLKKAELAQALEAGLLSAQDYYAQVRELDAALAVQTLALLDLKIAKEKEAYEWAVKELGQRQAAGEISPEAGGLAARKLALEHETRLIALNAEKTRTRLEEEKRLVEVLREQLEAREKLADLLLDEEGRAAFTEIEQREAAINKLLEEQRRRRQELLDLLAKSGASPAESAAALAAFDAAAGRQLQIARFGQEAKEWALVVTGGLNDLVDALIHGGRSLKETINRFFQDLFKQSLVPGFKVLQATMEKLFLDLFGSMGKSLMTGIMGVIGLVGMLLTGGGGGGSFSASGATTGITGHEAVRGIIGGETSIPIGEIGDSLQDALVPTNSILDDILSELKRGLKIGVSIDELKGDFMDALDEYFAQKLMTGA